jgi:hypothetical protein
MQRGRKGVIYLRKEGRREERRENGEDTFVG